MTDSLAPSPAIGLYLDMMKRVLTDSIFTDDPLAYFVPYRERPQTVIWKRIAVKMLQRFLLRYRLRVVEPYSDRWVDYTTLDQKALDAIRERGARWPVRAHTMIGLRRLSNLQHCAETVIREGIPGDFIETGVWRGGACIFMRAVLKVYGDTTRIVWVADSFAGLPPPDAQTYPADAGDPHSTLSDWLACSQEQVEGNFRRYGLLDDQVRFLNGWFKDTLPNAPIRQLAVLRLDGDMYESTLQAFNALYDKLSPGGFVIIDDYFLKPCAQAVHDFRKVRGISDEIRDIDGMAVFWRRSACP